MMHRRDIDGLRAIAVMAVILAHAGFAFVPSGHAGVDVFFAISGYLIGGIIANDLDRGEFSFRAFYARRARRILPALFGVLLACLPLAGWLMTPYQLRYFGGGAFAALAFLSNVWFFNRIDYFNPEAASDPLVHTWSLGVEEQFYLAAPVLMLWLWRFGRRWVVAILAALAFISFVAMLGAVSERPMAAFYLPQFRVWELFLGVLAALAQSRYNAALPAPIRNALALAGLVTILGSLVLIPAEALWPGPLTILPLAGTLLVLMFGNPEAAASRLLGLAPFVGVGLVSYSAYLWHQPVLGFLRISGHAPATVPEKLAVVAASLVLAWISWKWIEQPFRKHEVSLARTRQLLAIGLVAILGFALGGHITKGYPGRMPDDVLRMLEYRTAWPSSYRSCIGGRDEGERLDPASACIHGAEVPARVAIWGDSHAAVLAQPLGDALKPFGEAVRELTVGSCIPVGELKNSALKRTEYCAVHNARMLDYLVASPDIDVVILNGFWNSYMERRDFDTDAGWITTDAVIALPLDETPAMDDGTRMAFIADRLRAEVRRLTDAGKDVILLYPVPQAGFDPPEELARRLWKGETVPPTLGYPAEAFYDYSKLSRKVLDAAGDGSRVHRLDLSGAFCTPGGMCNVVENGVPLLFNENHLSLAGTAKIIPDIASEVRAILASRIAQSP
jgi:peptidoglycan/LPS O-acetylase OafA/YrhL